MAVWRTHDLVSMVRDHDEWAQSSSPAMSAMFTIMQMFYAREDACYFWQESYNIYVNKLMEAREVQRRLKKCVHKHKKTTREALWDTVDAHIALGSLQTQMENPVVDRNTAQAETQATHS